MSALLARLYRCHVLGRPRLVLALMLALFAFAGHHARDFRLDASADSLLLEGDPDLRRFREAHERYRTRELLVVTFAPEDDLFSDASLAHLEALRDALRGVAGVATVTSILDVPLLSSADVPLVDLVRSVPTLESHEMDRAKAREELRTSPVYRRLIISDDARMTAILLELEEDGDLRALARARNALVAKRHEEGLDAAEAARLDRLEPRYDAAHQAEGRARHRLVSDVRAVMDAHREGAELHLGGVPMITDDMVSYVANDLVVFGAGVFVFLVLVLALIFREVRWVLLPLLSCAYAGVTMVGLLGLIGWKVTVISSNFLALMLIITISMNIHLIVRYRQLRRDHPDEGQTELVATTCERMAWPCLYTALTTIIGFGSLVLSGIKPVIDFGWMMSIGLAVTFLTSFLLFPCVLALSGKSAGARPEPREQPLTRALARLTDRHGRAVLAVSVAVALAGGAGVARLRVENSFINYFRDSTEIHQGLKLVDERFGGTTSLQVLLRLPDPPDEFGPLEGEDPLAADDPEMTEEDRAFEAELAEAESDPAYWFTPDRIERIKEVHDYLAALPGAGKVLSLASMIRVGEALNDGEPFDGLQLALLYKRIPEDLRARLIDPYVSVEDQEARIFMRVVDSRPDLRRNEFLTALRRGLAEDLKLSGEDVTVTGLLVLYNNMLQSLFRSQIMTLGVVMLGIAAMFLVLFRSVPLAVIGIVPNLLGALAVLGIMGWAGIPLDMMTITIAAITIGIAVDNGIHYIYRFREEFARGGDYVTTLHLCHASIGRAVFYTTSTVIFGFSILILSNFVPTIYFGVFTALAMLIALLAALTLLPRLILIWKPFGPAAAPSPVIDS